LTIETNLNEFFDVYYYIYDNLGKLILNGEYKLFDNKEINISNLNKGVYIIKIPSETWTQTKRFVKTDA